MEVKETDSQCSERNKLFPDGVDLRGLKQKLLSASKDQIMQAVENIKICMDSEKFVVHLIKADICEFLCDAVLPSDGTLLENIYGCLSKMTKFLQFYDHSHSCYAIESIIRTSYFLLKTSSNTSRISQCLDLLVFITEGHYNFNISPEKKTIGNLIKLLMLMVKSDDITIENKFQIGNLFLNLINLNTLKLCAEFYNAILTCASWWFSTINCFSQSVHPFKEKLIFLCCRLSYSFLSCLAMENDFFEGFDSKNNDTIKNEVIIQISHFLVQTGVSYFDKEFWNYVNNDSTNLEFFLQALLFFLNNEIPIQKKYVMHGLSEMGFIQFATKIISFSDKTQSLQKLCSVVLFQLIKILSEDVLYYPDCWPNGHLSFHELIQEGISKLPADAAEWLDILASPDSPDSCKMIVLLYLYFYTLTAQSEVSMDNIYSSIVNFINHSFDLDSPVLIVKILWLVFVISELSCSQYSSLNSENEALDKLVVSLEAQQDLSLVYTHHPAILIWTFSSKVKCCIQFQIVQLWLQNKSSDCRELEELIEKSTDVRFTVLDILLKEEGKVLDLVFSSLKSVLIEKQSSDLASNVWYLLPKVLAKYSTDSMSAKNIDYLIELSSLQTPNTLDPSKVLRIILLLPEIVFSSCLISTVPSLKLIYQVLKLGRKLEDPRIFSALIRSENFIEELLERLFSNINEVSLIVLKLITYLWKFGKEFENINSFKKIFIRKETFVKVLESESIEVLSSALDFVTEVIATQFHSPVFEVENIDSEFSEVLFFEVQNICMKNIPQISQQSWLCLKLFLKIEIFQQELATNPLVHELIKFFLPNLKNCQEMKDFLIVWMEENNKLGNNWCGVESRIFGRFYLETLQAIAQNGVQNTEEGRLLYEKMAQAGVPLQ